MVFRSQAGESLHSFDAIHAMHPVEMSRNKSTLIVLDVANKVPNEWLIPEFRYLVDCFLQVIFAKC